MISRHSVYSGVQVLWLLGWIGVAVAVGSGLATAVVDGLTLPAGRPAVAGGAVAAALAGYAGVGHLKVRAWRATGREVGLAPDPEESILDRYASGPGASVAISPLPDLVGAVDGREVRVTTYATSGGGADGDSGTTYTVVKATLNGTVDDGFLLLPTPDGSAAEVVGPVPDSIDAERVDDEFAVLGGDGEDVSAMLTGRARESLLALERGGVIVGDPTEYILEELLGGMAGQMAMLVGEDEIEAGLRETPAFDQSGVAINAEGVLGDPETLDRQVTAVTALAGTVERVGPGAPTP